MKNLQRADPSFRLSIGPKSYSAEEVAQELEKQTEVGKEVVESYLKGLEFFKS